MTVPAASQHAELGALRFAPERQQLEQLMATFELVSLPFHFEREGGCSFLRDNIVSSQLKLRWPRRKIIALR